MTHIHEKYQKYKLHWPFRLKGSKGVGTGILTVDLGL